MGRKTTYSAQVADAVLARLATGETLRAICRDEGMPPESSVREWALDDREGFAARYARAREMGAYAMADEMLEIVDDGSNDWMERRKSNGEIEPALNNEHVQRSRLRADKRQWLLSKILPRVFGDKLDVTTQGQALTQAVDRPEKETREQWLERRSREIGVGAAVGAATRSTD